MTLASLLIGWSLYLCSWRYSCVLDLSDVHGGSRNCYANL